MKMKWKLLQGGGLMLLLLYDLLAVVDAREGKTGREVKGPPQVLSHLAVPTATTNDSAEGVPQKRVNLPSMECSNDLDCVEYSPSVALRCHNGQCSCYPPACWVYHYEAESYFTAKHVFTCGECGVLGSSCNTTIECDFPGVCESDGYCHCQEGENYSGVCATSNFGWSSTMALVVMAIVFFFALCITAVNCYKEPPWRNPEAWRCRCCPGECGARNGRRRRASCEKSPAFTVQAHYASQELDTCQQDMEGVSSASHGLGGAVPRRPRSHSSNSDMFSSISSANTNTTTVSDSVSRYSIDDTSLSPPPPPSPPPSPSHSFPLSSPATLSLPSTSTPPTPPPPYSPSPSTSLSPPPLSLPSTNIPRSPSRPPSPSPPPALLSFKSEEAVGSQETDVSAIQLQDISPEASDLRPSTSKSSPEIANTSSGVSGSCTHERCQLCLPKGPTTRSSDPPRNRTPQHRHHTIRNNLPLPQPDSAQKGNNIELTKF